MQTIVVFSGAGLSAESGIPTFRDAGGLWENHRFEEVASPEGWRRDPELVLRFYGLRHEAIARAEPNDAHRAIADLEQRYRVINWTQNIDNLLERAGCTDVRHMHGSVFRQKCEHHREAASGKGWCDYLGECPRPVQPGDLCPECGGQLRPDVVWFGEMVQFEFSEVHAMCRELEQNDGVFICVGTSGMVQPAASLISLFAGVRRKYLINPDAVPVGDYELLAESASTGLRRLARVL